MEQAEAAENPIHKKMAELRMACQREIRIQQQRSEFAASFFRDSLRSIKSKAEENQDNREKLGKLKEYLGKLEADLGDALAVKTCKAAKQKAIAESISTTIARTEQLEKKIQDQRVRKDEYAALISQQLLILGALEEKSKEDVTETKNVEVAIMWYRRVLGFRTEGGGEGVKFLFNNSAPKNPDKEYAFTVRLNGDIYKLVNCDPYMEDVDESMKDLNETNDLFKFVRIMREKFQAATFNGALPESSVNQASTSIIVSSPPPISMDSRNPTPINENIPQLKPANSLLKSRRQAPTPSPQSISNLRRSPRFATSSFLEDFTFNVIVKQKPS